MKSLNATLCSDDNLNNKEYWKIYERLHVKFSPLRKSRRLYDMTDVLGPMVRSITYVHMNTTLHTFNIYSFVFSVVL